MPLIKNAQSLGTRGKQADRLIGTGKKKKSPSLRTNRVQMGSINLEKSKAVQARKIFRPTETSEGWVV
jgi:hypothetical protein